MVPKMAAVHFTHQAVLPSSCAQRIHGSGGLGDKVNQGAKEWGRGPCFTVVWV